MPPPRNSCYIIHYMIVFFTICICERALYCKQNSGLTVKLKNFLPKRSWTNKIINGYGRTARITIFVKISVSEPQFWTRFVSKNWSITLWVSFTAPNKIYNYVVIPQCESREMTHTLLRSIKFCWFSQSWLILDMEYIPCPT